MGRKGLLIKQFLNNAFVTTAIVLIRLILMKLMDCVKKECNHARLF